ncbi:MAG TPA: hypothetical protein VFS66_09345 [Acidimicrobiia bacterium]|nr:hypothetical protein [Acidimicrobiia bacterium]
MLLRRETLDRIVAGDVDLAFRRWTRPTVKSGGTLRTQVGMLEIELVEVVPLGSVTGEDARRAGVDINELISFLSAKSEGEVYRVEFGRVVPDPRVALRNDDDLSDADYEEVRARLERLDLVSRRGPWTNQFLRLIADKPHVRAQDLADGLGLEKMVFKNDVAKLKGLGLTISHSPGYELSPRGRAVLKRLKME